MSTTKPIIRAAAWTTWIGATLASKGVLAPLAPAIGPIVDRLADRADDLLASIIGNWISEDLRAQDLDPGSLDANGHIERLTALAIQGVIVCLPKHDPRFADQAKLCRKLGAALADYWPTLNLLNQQPVPDARTAALSTNRVHQAVFEHIQDPRTATALTPELWKDIIGAAYGDAPADLIEACAKALHRELPRYLYEAVKAAADKFPQAHSAIHLRIFQEQTALLKSLHQHADEMSQWFTVRLDDLQRHLRAQGREQQNLVQRLGTEVWTAADTTIQALKATFEDTRVEFASLHGAIAEVKEDTSHILRFLREELPGMLAAAQAGMRFNVPRHLPKAAGQLFGREADLERALPLLLQHGKLAIEAEGGIGKTAFSAALIARLEATAEGKHLTRGGIYLHDFYRQPSLAAFVGSILTQAGIRCESPQQQPALAAAALRQPGTLLYIEGAEKLGSLSDLLDFLDEGTHLILTTRPRTDIGELATYALEPLDEVAAARALHYYATHSQRSRKAGPYPVAETDPGWLVLARDLGGHALACELAGNLCGLNTQRPEVLHQQLRAQGLKPLIKGQSSKQNLNVLFRQSALSVLAAEGTEQGQPSPALEAWRMLTLGGSNPTPLSVLTALGLADVSTLQPLLDLRIAWSTEVPSALHNASNVAEAQRYEPGYALSHALLAEWARVGLEEFGCSRAEFQGRAFGWGKAMRDAVVHHSCVPGGHERYSLMAPIFEGLLGEAKQAADIEPGALHISYYLAARSYELHANHLAAEPLYREALEQMERLAGPETPETATALNNLATLLLATNRMAEAEESMRRALRIDEACYGLEHPEVATDLNNLAQLLKATNRLAHAEEPMRRALRIDEARFGTSHPRVAIRLNNLAALLYGTNRIVEAEKLMRRVATIFEVSYGPSYPNVATALNNLAALLQDTNRLDKAEEPMRRVVTIFEVSYGPTHPAVAIALNNLALLLQATNRMAEAEEPMRRALVVFMQFTRRTGHSHPHLEGCTMNYFGLLCELGRSEAEALAEIEALRQQQM